ncbi:MAG: hypothetical protein NT084_06140 [Bacteroidetes bacterium]|nr:hypothetical protein [Bacteroidota bacterium]
MKNYLTFQMRISSLFYSALSLLFIGVFVLMSNNVMAQDKKDTTKMSISMNVSYKISDGIKHVKVQATRKENKKNVSVDNATSPVSLYLNEVKATDPSTGDGLISKLFLNEEGEVTFDLPANFNSLTSGLHEYTFIARMEADPIYQEAEEQITIADAKITVEYSGKDSIKTATATLMEWKDSAYVPVRDAELKLFIKRTFSLYPIGEEGITSDSLGQITSELPLDIPGEADGTIIIVGSVIDHETYGTVETTNKVKWAVLPKVNADMGRTLWSTGKNAPVPLIIASCTIIAIIWGTIIYLILQLFKIRKIGKQKV